MTARAPALVLAFALAACGSEESPPAASDPAASDPAPAASEPARPAAPPPAASPASAAPPAPDRLPNGIVLALAQFVTETGEDGGSAVVPGPARLEFLYRSGGAWRTATHEDPDSNVFHKAMVYDPGSGPRVLTLGGTAAIVKLWDTTPSGLEGTVVWKEDFGGKWSRMRDAEAADLYGDGRSALAVATHDQGVVATIRPRAHDFEVTQLDRQPDTFVHEIEVGDLDADGVPEIYATPSEPNRLDGTPQSGQVVRYVPQTGGERTVVAELGTRHAKEILVGDVDGDGVDELYVSVEAELEGERGAQRIVEPVEIRRYEADTPPDQGAVIAVLDDSLSRFLTAGDVDGDGQREMVATAFSSGVWLLRPGEDPNARWEMELVDRSSAGFEHASILTDLDGDGTDELYVASDKHKEVRRYVWNGERLVRETIYRRPDDRPIFTWNLMPVPLELIPRGEGE